MALIDTIFQRFPRYFKTQDVFPDGNGRGLNERFHRMLGDYYDTDILAPIADMVENLIDPFTAQAQFLPLLEAQAGNPVIVQDNLTFRRRILSVAHQIYNIKGTKRSYELLLKMLGFDTITINESFTANSFDQSIGFDNPDRVFDESCPACSFYDIVITGGLVLNDTIRQTIFKIDDFLRPINAELNQVTVNGTEITFHLISLQIDSNGDLIYDPVNTPELNVFLDDQGNLIIEGPDADKYFINSNGDLIYIQ